MVDKVEVDPELLRQAAVKTDYVNSRLRSVVDGLMGSLSAKGEPWGNDSYGEEFAGSEDGSGYKAARKTLKDLSDTLAKNAETNSDGQNQSGKKLDGTDQNSASQFGK
ncbi:WXG100 family type VII secretion target [Nocardia sp. NPDC059228]|uniref:WXG100 family type VII secretion target n=1 Tax=Nocardia sp. NPDC059228 TaxID=3346777 RepID=UPI00367A1939